jgi:hypothetical protein
MGSEVRNRIGRPGASGRSAPVPHSSFLRGSPAAPKPSTRKRAQASPGSQEIAPPGLRGAFFSLAIIP